MSDRPSARPLRGHVVLVVGAGDPTARALALHLSALGAAVIAAGPALDAVVVTAGLIAASGGTVRVVETAAPPCGGRALVAAAQEALETPTAAFLSESAFPSAAAVETAARELSAWLPPGTPALCLRATTVPAEQWPLVDAAVRAILPPAEDPGSPGAARAGPTADER